ncbi:calcium/proton exchanger [Oscillochloris sp. ZM17-4]|uniref:calcium/proton exchanger n=1 Tax=Oscillochloris sp. ZM17-4 TaxID=2866714 RepID=UPI001C73D657|nr:calcium/proton exchanger [Oscillochloris sp. ZM17-4]MBX0329035.1 calcium/proton exchanger [Oscillochloris sp. ZM17-4]
MKWLRYMMVFVPAAFLLEFVPALKNDILLFAVCCLGLVPLAGYLGEATEELSVHTGPKIGGLLNATLGNAAELIITIVALQAGKFELVKASITGSILGNLLLIMGASLFFGGLRHGIQRFDRQATGVSASMMTLAVIGLAIPTIFEVLRQISIGQLNVFSTQANDAALNGLSLGVAAILMLLYVLSLVFSFQQPERGVGGPTGVDDHREGEAPHKAKWNVPTAVGVLAASTLAIVFLSEFLVGAVEPTVEALGLSEFFVGIIIIPLVGNVAEHIVGVQMAWKNKMDLSLAISLGSSTQVALFVAPLLVFVSLLVAPTEMTLFFSIMEVAALTLSVLIATIISVDGESNWLEGAQLLAVYAIIAMGFFYLSPVGG